MALVLFQQSAAGGGHGTDLSPWNQSGLDDAIASGRFVVGGADALVILNGGGNTVQLSAADASGTVLVSVTGAGAQLSLFSPVVQEPGTVDLTAVGRGIRLANPLLVVLPGTALRLTAALADGLTVIGYGAVAVTNLQATPAANLSGITTLSLTATATLAGSVVFTGDLGQAAVSLGGSGSLRANSTGLQRAITTVGPGVTLNSTPGAITQLSGARISTSGTGAIELADLNTGATTTDLSGLSGTITAIVRSSQAFQGNLGTVPVQVQKDVTLTLNATAAQLSGAVFSGEGQISYAAAAASSHEAINAYTVGANTLDYSLKTAAAQVVVTSGSGADAVTTGLSTDTVSTGAGNDTIVLTGNGAGAGNDRIVFGNGEFAAADTITGGGGVNAIRLAADAQTISDAAFANKNLLQSLTTANGLNGISFGANAQATGITSITGGTAADSFIATGMTSALTISVGNGDDTIRSGFGADWIDAGDGNDYVTAGDGNDYVTAGDGNDTVIAGDGNDFVVMNEGDDSVIAGDGDDDVQSGKGNDTIVAGSGNDFLNGGSTGDDVIYGDAGDDTLRGASGVDQLTGGTSADDFLMGDIVAADGSLGVDLIIDFSLAQADQIGEYSPENLELLAVLGDLVQVTDTTVSQGNGAVVTAIAANVNAAFNMASTIAGTNVLLIGGNYNNATVVQAALRTNVSNSATAMAANSGFLIADATSLTSAVGAWLRFLI